LPVVGDEAERLDPPFSNTDSQVHLMPPPSLAWHASLSSVYCEEAVSTLIRTAGESFSLLRLVLVEK
jgi:hypothetical protein